jgi:riboflavin synthase
MFTGLIEETGTVREALPFAGGKRFVVAAPALARDLRAGDSIACDGVCLTVEQSDPAAGTFRVAAVEATLRRTTAGGWGRGRRIHLERALAAGDRLGGHWVQGHIDGVARVVRAVRAGGALELWLQPPAALARYIVPQGSLALDGVSLTVAARRGPLCAVALVPETLARTRLGGCRPGDRVNLEVDLIAKYVESIGAGHRSSRRTTS